MQSQSLRDTGILEEHLHITEDMEVTQERPHHPEKLEGREAATQELSPLQLPVEAIFENQEDVETKTQEDVVTQEPTS